MAAAVEVVPTMGGRGCGCEAAFAAAEVAAEAAFTADEAVDEASSVSEAASTAERP